MTVDVEAQAPDRTVTVYGDDGAHDVPLWRLEPVAYAELVDAHPRDAGDPPGLPWSETTFPPALIAAVARVHRIHALEWWDEWPEDAADELLQACLELCDPGDFSWALRRLDQDPRLALELAVCAGRLPHDVFLTWSRRSQDLAIAAHVRAGDRCPGCGVPTGDMQNPLAADVQLRSCVHCELRHEISETIPEADRHRIYAFVVPTRDQVPEG